MPVYTTAQLPSDSLLQLHGCFVDMLANMSGITHNTGNGNTSVENSEFWPLQNQKGMVVDKPCL